MFEKLSGRKPLSCAAPGWQISSVSLEVQEEAGLEYCSDTRGRSPFLPVFEGRSYTPVQIPSTLPTMDEILGLPGIDDDSIGDVWLNGMNNEWNVLTVHAEMEGLSKIGVFEKFIIKAKENGTVFYTLADYARDSAPGECNIEIGTITGRAGTLASQEDE
jgi:peptidoglycan/xylan/chitin deacetylase (PgdA/CDA1 family)